MEITLSPLLVVVSISGAALCCCVVSLLCVWRINSLRNQALNPTRRERSNATEDPGKFGTNTINNVELKMTKPETSQGPGSQTRSGSFFHRPAIKEFFKDYKYTRSDNTLVDRTRNLAVPSELNHLHQPKVSSFDIELAAKESVIGDESLTNSTMDSDDDQHSFEHRDADDEHDLSIHDMMDDEDDMDEFDRKSSSDFDDGPKAWASDFTLSTVGTNYRSQNITVLRWTSHSTNTTNASSRASIVTDGSTPLTNVTSLTGSSLDSLDLERESVQRELKRLQSIAVAIQNRDTVVEYCTDEEGQLMSIEDEKEPSMTKEFLPPPPPRKIPHPICDSGSLEIITQSFNE